MKECSIQLISTAMNFNDSKLGPAPALVTGDTTWSAKNYCQRKIHTNDRKKCGNLSKYSQTI